MTDMAWIAHAPTTSDFRSGYDAAIKASRLIMDAQENELDRLRRDNERVMAERDGLVQELRDAYELAAKTVEDLGGDNAQFHADGIRLRLKPLNDEQTPTKLMPYMDAKIEDCGQ